MIFFTVKSCFETICIVKHCKSDLKSIFLKASYLNFLMIILDFKHLLSTTIFEGPLTYSFH